MLLKLLSIIFLLALFRFAYRLVRAVLTATKTRPEVRSRDRTAEGLKGKRIIDVEFTEEESPDPDRNHAR